MIELLLILGNKPETHKIICFQYSSMQNHQSQLINAFVYIYNAVKDVQVEVLDKQLIRWKRDQQLAGNGYQMSPAFLDTLQEW